MLCLKLKCFHRKFRVLLTSVIKFMNVWKLVGSHGCGLILRLLTVTVVRRIASLNSILVASVAHGAVVVVTTAISSWSWTAVVLVLIISAASPEAKESNCVTDIVNNDYSLNYSLSSSVETGVSECLTVNLALLLPVRTLSLSLRTLDSFTGNIVKEWFGLVVSSILIVLGLVISSSFVTGIVFLLNLSIHLNNKQKNSFSHIINDVTWSQFKKSNLSWGHSQFFYLHKFNKKHSGKSPNTRH